MQFLQYIWGPLVGAVIGYFTNYIAVKMLFLPRDEVRLFGKKLPFTPGIIPRRKQELARSVGKMVEKELLTKEALCGMMLSDKAKGIAAMSITNAITAGERPLKELMPDLTASDMRFRLENIIAGVICDGVCRLDLATPIAKEGGEMVREKFGALGGLLVTDKVMADISVAADQRIKAYLLGNRALLTAAIHEKVDDIISMNTESIADNLLISAEDVYPIATSLYEKLVEKHLPSLLEKVSIADTVAAKIDVMDARHLEDMLLSVMKKELSAVVNLGAVIGFILGLLNLII